MTSQPAESGPLLDYGQRLNHDRAWAMEEGDRYFREDNSTFHSLRKLVGRLEELAIPYAVTGCLAMFAHGFRKFTENVEIIVRPEGLSVIHEKLKGDGYQEAFPGRRHLRDRETGVNVRFFVSGEYPGDGCPKPVATPDPVEARIERRGIFYISLAKLIEGNLASGMTGGVTRLGDLSDVVELIQRFDLPREFVESLNPYVRDRFLELWDGVQQSPTGPHGD